MSTPRPVITFRVRTDDIVVAALPEELADPAGADRPIVEAILTRYGFTAHTHTEYELDGSMPRIRRINRVTDALNDLLHAGYTVSPDRRLWHDLDHVHPVGVGNGPNDLLAGILDDTFGRLPGIRLGLEALAEWCLDHDDAQALAINDRLHGLIGNLDEFTAALNTIASDLSRLPQPREATPPPRRARSATGPPCPPPNAPRTR